MGFSKTKALRLEALLIEADIHITQTLTKQRKLIHSHVTILKKRKDLFFRNTHNNTNKARAPSVFMVQVLHRGSFLSHCNSPF